MPSVSKVFVLIFFFGFWKLLFWDSSQTNACGCLCSCYMPWGAGLYGSPRKSMGGEVGGPPPTILMGGGPNPPHHAFPCFRGHQFLGPLCKTRSCPLSVCLECVHLLTADEIQGGSVFAMPVTGLQCQLAKYLSCGPTNVIVSQEPHQ